MPLGLFPTWQPDFFPIYKMAAIAGMTRCGGKNSICQMISMKKCPASSPMIFSIPPDYFVFIKAKEHTAKLAPATESQPFHLQQMSCGTIM